MFGLVILNAADAAKPRSVFAQDLSNRIEIASLDTSGFPEIQLRLAVTDTAGNAITDSSGITIFEDGTLVESMAVSSFDPGAELIVIIDANLTIESRDGTDQLSRREKVRDSLIRYANHFMDPMQKDSVTIIVPDGSAAQIQERENLSYPTEVINAINFYETGELSETNVTRLFQSALEVAENLQSQGRHQSILLFSDAAELDSSMDYEAVVERAQELGVTIYGAILGGRADLEEIENMSRLTEPTGGSYVHMPDPVLADPVYETIQQRASQFAITYRSKIAASGQHTLVVSLMEEQESIQFELSVEPPSVQLAVDNSRPIRRVAESDDTPLDQMQPTEQPLVAQVGWPDGYQRDLTAAELLIEDVALPAEQAIVDDSGLLTFNWNIRQLDAGVYNLQVRITDELGLQAVSEPLPLTIAVDRPSVVVTATAERPPTPAPVATIAPEVVSVSQDTQPVGMVMIAGGIVLLVVLLGAVVGAVFFLGNRSRSTDIDPAPADGLPALSQGNEYTYVIPPEFADDESVGAYLEVLENAPEHDALIPIIGNNIALGRDSRRVQVVFKDRSVSRLHARILESRGEYRIYEEGSSSGTYVNFERLGLAPQKLEDKDRIHLGRVHLRFHLA